jgi:hypothetical protein
MSTRLIKTVAAAGDCSNLSTYCTKLAEEEEEEEVLLLKVVRVSCNLCNGSR